jgi:predicted CXXCH cytochrome family protein
MIFTGLFTGFRRGLRNAGVSALVAGAILVGTPGAVAGDNRTCVGCHTTQGLATQFPSSEKLPLTINAASLKSSVHGTQDCTACHVGIREFPHPKNTAVNYREFQLENSRHCETCHAEQAKQELDSHHARALAAGNKNAAVCTDCHGSHTAGKPDSPRHRISTSCGRCHGAIYTQYISSVHGRSLLEIENSDAPVCTDCHEAHKQEDPTTQAFRLKSPKICATCHANAELMRKYNITADVFDTYVADFHGLTVTLFDRQHPGQRMNTAVCTDCHGIHDIQKVTDAQSSVIKQNLLTTCRKCHPEANLNFPDSWLGHFQPTRDRHPLVYWVNVFYRFVIPITIGGMVVFVLIDAGGRVIRRFRKGRT